MMTHFFGTSRSRHRDMLGVDGSPDDATLRTLGTGPNQAASGAHTHGTEGEQVDLSGLVQSNDPRLTDPRAPLPHDHDQAPEHEHDYAPSSIAGTVDALSTNVATVADAQATHDLGHVAPNHDHQHTHDDKSDIDHDHDGVAAEDHGHTDLAPLDALEAHATSVHVDPAHTHPYATIAEATTLVDAGLTDHESGSPHVDPAHGHPHTHTAADVGAAGSAHTHDTTHNHDAAYSASGHTHQAEVPSGTVVMWFGTIATIPAGWVLCNGANGTPDLRDMFVRGAPNAAQPGATAGAAQHGHSVTQPGNHTVTEPAAHTGVVNHTHAMAASNTAATSGSNPARGTGAQGTVTAPNPSGGVANLPHTGTAVSAHSGAAVAAGDNLPPYRTTLFIMKV